LGLEAACLLEARDKGYDALQGSIDLVRLVPTSLVRAKTRTLNLPFTEV